MKKELFDLMTKMYAEMQEMKKEFKEEIQKCNDEIKTVGRQVTDIENKADTKLSALFDGYAQNTDKLEAVINDIAEIKEEMLNVESMAISNRRDIINLKRIK